MYYPGGLLSPKPTSFYKRNGLFRARARPRGATHLVVFNDAENPFKPYNIYTGIPVANTGAFNKYPNSPFGAGANNLGISTPAGATTPAQCSLEVLLQLTAIPNALATLNLSATASGTYDRMLYFTSTGAPTFYIFDGATKLVAGPNMTANGQLVHLVGVANGADIKLFVNGILVNTTATSNGGATYAPYLYIGTHATPTAGGSGDPPVLLAQFATVAWNEMEIKQRFMNPYRDIYASEDWGFDTFVGAAAVGGVTTNSAVSVIG